MSVYAHRRTSMRVDWRRCAWCEWALRLAALIEVHDYVYCASLLWQINAVFVGHWIFFIPKTTPPGNYCPVPLCDKYYHSFYGYETTGFIDWFRLTLCFWHLSYEDNLFACKEKSITNHHWRGWVSSFLTTEQHIKYQLMLQKCYRKMTR